METTTTTATTNRAAWAVDAPGLIGHWVIYRDRGCRIKIGQVVQVNRSQLTLDCRRNVSISQLVSIAHPDAEWADLKAEGLRISTALARAAADRNRAYLASWKPGEAAEAAAAIALTRPTIR